MKRRNKGIRLIYLIMLLLILITPILICIYNLIKYPANSESINEESVIDISNLALEENTYNYQTEILNEDNTSVEPHIDENTKAKYITYEDIGINNSELEDDYEIIKKTHEIANANKYEVRATLDEYHIYRLDDIAPIYIETNTDWNGAKFIIHDENIKDLKTKNYPIFQILSTEEKEIIIDNEDILNSITINKQTKKIEELAGYGDCLCIIYNSNKKQYIRSGSNNNLGNDQLDLFKIDNNGNVLNEIQWDFDEVTKIRLMPIPEEQIIIQNGNFQTNIDAEEDEQTLSYLNRNIVCNRSNTILKNLNHTLDKPDKLGGPYYGFIKIGYATEVELLDSKLISHKYQKASNYDLIIEYSTNITLDNVTSDYLDEKDRWGITGTNYTKDIEYKNCALNRIDAHCGVHNLTISDSIIGIHGITVVGSGKLDISNVNSSSNNAFIILRSDYGSTWDGEINIQDSTYKNNYSSQLINFKVLYDENNDICNYGYDLYLPDINIDNLIIDNKNSQRDFYIFYNDPNNTGNEDGDISEIYNLPKNVLIKNYAINFEKKLYLFYQKFYNNLEELGINLSIPLLDKKEVQVKNNSEENIEENIITNNDITIKIEQIEGIQTVVKVNNKKITENEKSLDAEGTYNIEVIYKNSIGESSVENKKITIDKTSPIITGVKNTKTYKNRVIPNIKDDNLQEVKLIMDGQEVENYILNSEINECGIYKIIAIDKSGNEAEVNFQIIEPGEDDYKIENDMILNINNNTKKHEFFRKFDSDEEFNILRGKRVLTDEDKIYTGDILEYLDTEEQYILIVVGDIDKNGEVTVTDLAAMNQHILKDTELEGIQLISADMNNDKKITATDFATIMAIIQKDIIL